jgi:hypothetical protein
MKNGKFTLNMASVGPSTVMIRSVALLPSIFILALHSYTLMINSIYNKYRTVGTWDRLFQSTRELLFIYLKTKFVGNCFSDTIN